MEDIIAFMPWCCDDKDCTVQWHLANYWIYPKGSRCTYSVDWYSDGDHETVYKKDLPSDKEVNKAWSEYYEYCAETGKDPLCEFRFSKYFTKNVKFRAGINDSIAGPFVFWIMKCIRGKWQYTRQTKETLEYLCVKSRPPSKDYVDFKNVAEIRRILTENPDHHVQPLTRRNRAPFAHIAIEFMVDEKVNRSEKEIAKEIRKRARTALKGLCA